MDKTELAEKLRYALGTEVDAVNMYSKMVKLFPPEFKGGLKHILDEEKEHMIELAEMIAKIKNA